VRLPTREDAQRNAAALLQELQIAPADLARLRDVPGETLLAAAAKVAPVPMTARSFAPSIGRADLPLSPLAAVAAGSARVPLIVGCTKHEATLFLIGRGVDPWTMTDDGLQKIGPSVLGPDAPALLAGYKKNHPDMGPGDILVRAMTDGMMRYPSIKLAEAHAKAGGAPTYMYLFAWESPVTPSLKAAHGIDGTFYFNNIETVNIAAGNKDARALAAMTSAAWATFARDGTPKAPGLVPWPTYAPDKRETMIFAAPPRIESDPLKDDRLLRDRLTPL
ncbi:MAG: carboxylesterase family protein, partial [Parvularculaceae bacterium]|nr:carboxylesterase family protein [Parvularculaceae bacterium]